MEKTPTSQDLNFIEQQLGRKPRAIIEVSARCKSGLSASAYDAGRHWRAGHPLVVKTRPVLVRSGKCEVGRLQIFPTLYYLVCGSVIEQVSKLESESFLAEMQQKVDTDSDFRAALLKAQEDYRNERNALVDVVLSESQKEALNTGIGGVKQLNRIKCLHCHLAHYLAGRDNPVGRIVGDILIRRGHTCFTDEQQVCPHIARMSPSGRIMPINPITSDKLVNQHEHL